MIKYDYIKARFFLYQFASPSLYYIFRPNKKNNYQSNSLYLANLDRIYVFYPMLVFLVAKLLYKR